MALKKDLLVQIAGDETQLNRALERAEGRLTKYTASVRAQSDAQAQAYARAGVAANAGVGHAGRYASAVEQSSGRVRASLTAMAAHHADVMRRVGQQTVTAGRSISSAGTSLLGFVAPIGLIGAASGKMAADFSKNMELLHTQANYSQKQVEALSKAALDMAPSLGVAPKEIAEGLYHVASAGIPAAKAMEVVEQAMKGAKLGIADADETAYALVSILKAAPKDIHNAADAMGMLNAIVGQGDMRMQQLVDALGTGVVPRARAAGLGLRDVGAALDVMTQRGMPAQVSGTRLSQTFAFLEKQSKSAEKALEGVGIKSGEFGRELEKPDGLLRAVELLHEHLKDSGKSLAEQNKVILTAFGGGRSSAAIQVLLENVSELRKQYDKLPESAKAVERVNEAWKALNQTPAQKFAELQSKMSKTLIELGNQILPVVIPVAEKAVKVFGAITEAFNGLGGGSKKFIIDATLGVAAIALLAKPIGAVVTAIGFITKGFGSAGKVAAGFGDALAIGLGKSVPAVEAAGAEAGAAYGTAFTTTAETRMMPLMGGGTVPFMGPGGRSGAWRTSAGRGTPSFAEDYRMGMRDVYASGEPMWMSQYRENLQTPAIMPMGAPVAAKLGLGARLMGGATVGFTGLMASQLAGGLIGGQTGHDVAQIGSTAALGAAIGSAVAPGLGTAVGAGLGAIAGALKKLPGVAQEETDEEFGHHGKKGKPDYSRTQFAKEARKDRENEEKELDALRKEHPYKYQGGVGGRGVGPLVTPSTKRPYLEQREVEIMEQHSTFRGGRLGAAEADRFMHGREFVSQKQVIDSARVQMENLSGGGRVAFLEHMSGAIKQLEKEGRLLPGTFKKLVEQLGPMLGEVPNMGKKAAAEFVSKFVHTIGERKIQSALGSMTKDIASKWPEEMKFLPVTADMTFSEVVKNTKSNMAKLKYEIHHGTSEQRAAAKVEYEEMGKELGVLTKHAGDNVKKELESFARHHGPISEKAVQAIKKAYDSLPPSLKKKLEEAGGAVHGGLERMNAEVNKELQVFGIGRTIVIGSTPGNQHRLPGSAGGGYIGNRGERGGDNIPIVVGRGEAILNRHQQAYVDRSLSAARSMGVQPYGSLGELFARERTPHYMAKGGYAAMVMEANAIDSHHFPYKWGGGHGGFDGPYDCSGAVSAVLHAGGILSAPRVAGGFESFGDAGPGLVTLFVNDNTHVYMRMGGRYFGTSGANPGGGAGWFPGGPRPGFVERHVPPQLLGSGALIKTPAWTGPGGYLGAIGSAELHEAAKAANKYMEGQAFGGSFGGGNAGENAVHHATGGFVATAYGPPWGGIEGNGITATGVNLQGTGKKGDVYPHKYIVAADPSVLPMGSQVKIWPNPFGYTGKFLVADTGGAIKGKRIDFYDWRGRSAQNAWGRRTVSVDVTGSVTGGSRGSGLQLTGHQAAHIAHLEGDRAASASGIATLEGYRGEQGGFLETRQARWAAKPNDISTKEGARAEGLDREQVVLTRQSEKKFFDKELKLLRKEVKDWEKLRDYYRHIARHLHDKAKEQALKKAASFAGKILQAQKDAKAIKGEIYSKETEIIEAETSRDKLPAEAAEAAKQKQEETFSQDAGAYHAELTKIDAEVRAGIKTEQQGKEAKEAAASKALAGGFGVLSPEEELNIKGDLREFQKATTEATKALEDHTKAIEESTKALKEFTSMSTQIGTVENAVLSKALADLISGQIGGVDYHGRRNTPGAGTAARY